MILAVIEPIVPFEQLEKEKSVVVLNQILERGLSNVTTYQNEYFKCLLVYSIWL